MASRVQFAWVPSLSSVGMLKEGKLVALAVSTSSRIAALPGVPTIAGAGYPGGEFDFWLGLLAPGKTPRDIVAKVDAEVNRALKALDMVDRLVKLGDELSTHSSANGMKCSARCCATQAQDRSNKTKQGECP